MIYASFLKDQVHRICNMLTTLSKICNRHNLLIVCLSFHKTSKWSIPCWNKKPSFSSPTPSAREIRPTKRGTQCKSDKTSHRLHWKELQNRINFLINTENPSKIHMCFLHNKLTSYVQGWFWSRFPWKMTITQISFTTAIQPTLVFQFAFVDTFTLTLTC